VAEQPTDSADVEIELRQNPLHRDDKDERKSKKGGRDRIKSKKDEKIMEGLAQYVNPDVKNDNAKKGNAKNTNEERNRKTTKPQKEG